MNIQFWGDVISTTGMLAISMYIYKKSTNYSFAIRKTMFTVLWCFLWGLLYASKPGWIPTLIIHLISCAAFIFFIWRLCNHKLEMALSAYLLSYGISYCFLNIAMPIIFLAFIPILGPIYINDAPSDLNAPVFLLFAILVALSQFLLTYFLFKIKRFKNGFPFLFERYAVVVALIVTGVVVVFISLISDDNVNNLTFFSLFMGVIIIGVGIYIWIRRGIKMFYRKKMKDNSIELLDQELAKKEYEIQRLTEQNDIIRVANHKTTHRLAALEHSVIGLVEKMQASIYSMEISEELAVTLEDIKCLSSDYHEEIHRIKGRNPLPSTKIKMLDDLFGYFSEQCAESGIGFNLKINGSIPFMTEHVVEQNKLETMIGDHLQDALIAVNASGHSFRSILAVLGLVEDFYEFTVFDSGIPFEADTLIQLGTKRVTTHGDTGGSGIGFMTTFDTMRKYGASLVINEKKTVSTDYSKSVTIRFDGKHQYMIETYRPDVFQNRGDRFTVMASHDRSRIFSVL